MVVACEDCVGVHGDKPEEWLARCPWGADWQVAYRAHLCDGCFGHRIREETRAQPGHGPKGEQHD
jgi:hypothetical protein